MRRVTGVARMGTVHGHYKYTLPYHETHGVQTADDTRCTRGRGAFKGDLSSAVCLRAAFLRASRLPRICCA